MRPTVSDNGIISGHVLAKGPPSAAFGADAIAEICWSQVLAASEKRRSDLETEWDLHGIGWRGPRGRLVSLTTDKIMLGRNN